MIFDEDRKRIISELVPLYREVRKTDDKLHPKSEQQLEWMLAAPKTAVIEKRDGEGKLIASMLVSDKKHYQAPVETYAFLKYLIGSRDDVSDQGLPAHPDIFWLECLCVEDSHRNKGIARDMVGEAIDYASENADELPCIVACGIMVENLAARHLAERCGFAMIAHEWTQEDFADDGSYDKDFAWNIFYKVVR